MDTQLGVSSLRNDGDTLTLPDGSKLRLIIGPDYLTDINDFDYYGEVEWTRDDSIGTQRPKSFTGRARILDRDRGQTLWWEPYEELTEQQIREELPMMKRLVAEGFYEVVIEHLDGKDAYGKPIVREFAVMSSISEIDPDDIHNIVDDLVEQLWEKESA